MGNYLNKIIGKYDEYPNRSLMKNDIKKRKHFELDDDDDDNGDKRYNENSYYFSSLFKVKKSNQSNFTRIDLEDIEEIDNNKFDVNRVQINANFEYEKGLKALKNNYLLKPHRKRMKSTSSYIYKMLFIEGENSDIKVKALNNEWDLHKIYLSQSPYFSSMFSGSKWKESQQSCIEIAIPDQNITLKSLNITFGSFYKEEIDLIPIESINVLACASLFSLEGLINQCASVMIENINADSVFAFYEASQVYGLKLVKEKTLNWLCLNIMHNEDIKLSEISINLFESIITSDDFLIVQVETDLYSLCKKWLYYQLNVNSNKTQDQKTFLQQKSQKAINEFFKVYLNQNADHKQCLLEIEKFSIYKSLFRKIRFQHIISDYLSLKLIYNERIIPHSWLEQLYFKNWLNVIYIDQDKFSHEFELNANEFENECLRFGRTLIDENPVTWRWVGFNYGVDLIVTHQNRSLSLKRNTLSMHSPYKGLLSNKNLQRIYYLIRLIELDKFGNEKWSKKTEVKCLDFNRNEEKVVMNIDTIAKYPLILNLRLITHPLNLSSLLLDNQL